MPVIQVLENYRGESLIVSAACQGRDQLSSIPSVVRYDDSNVHFVHFETASENLKSAYIGHYFCWLDEKIIHIFNLKTQITQDVDVENYLELGKQWDREYLALDACDTRSLAETGWISSVNKTEVDKLSNHMQVTYKNHVLIFNLNLESPYLYDEIDETD